METKMPYRNVLSGAQVFRCCVSTCRQPRLTTYRSKRQLACCCLGVGLRQGKGVRTGGRLHPGLAGERLPKQRPKPCSCFRRPRGCGTLPRRRSWFLERRLWVSSSQRGVCGPVANSAPPCRCRALRDSRGSRRPRSLRPARPVSLCLPVHRVRDRVVRHEACALFL